MDIRRLKDGYDVLDKLYDDNDLNCDNFAQAVREYRCSHEVITAVANLYDLVKLLFEFVHHCDLAFLEFLFLTPGGAKPK